jgi:hypothetical protein
MTRITVARRGIIMGVVFSATIRYFRVTGLAIRQSATISICSEVLVRFSIRSHEPERGHGNDHKQK